MEQAAENENVRALVITGAGRAFCAGQDLGEFSADSHLNLGEALENRYNRIVRSIRGMEKPVISAVNGPAVGAGANLALCADFVIAADSASFVQAFINLGLIPDCGGTFLLPRLVGMAKATELAMLGGKLSAAEAEKIGLSFAPPAR